MGKKKADTLQRDFLSKDKENIKKEMQGLDPENTMVDIRISTTEWRQSNQWSGRSIPHWQEAVWLYSKRFFIYILRSLKEGKWRAGLENYSNTWWNFFFSIGLQAQRYRFGWSKHKQGNLREMSEEAGHGGCCLLFLSVHQTRRYWIQSQSKVHRSRT